MAEVEREVKEDEIKGIQRLPRGVDVNDLSLIKRSVEAASSKWTRPSAN